MRKLSKTLATAAVVCILILAVTGSVMLARSHQEGPWIDTTDAVAEQSAGSAGRQAIDPLINTDQGNMLVFFFTLAGVLAGPVIGYNWRKLMVDKDREEKRLNKTLIIRSIITTMLVILAMHEAFASRPFIDPGLGDMKLFMFILLGTIAGFSVGYSWRRSQGKIKGGEASVR